MAEDHHQMSEQAADAEQLLRAAGKRITPQRAHLLHILQEHGGHLDADEIYRLMKPRFPRLSLSTVYRTLDLLKELELVRELVLDGEHHHYEIERGDEHQHLVCLGCGRVIEFQCTHCAQVHQDLADHYGFRITGSRVELLGYCAECQAREEE